MLTRVHRRKLQSRTQAAGSLDSERRVTAIEYGLITALIAVAIIVAVTLVGRNLAGLFNYIAGQVVAP